MRNPAYLATSNKGRTLSLPPSAPRASAIAQRSSRRYKQDSEVVASWRPSPHLIHALLRFNGFGGSKLIPLTNDEKQTLLHRARLSGDKPFYSH